MATHFNISGELTQQLLAPGDNVNVSKISLTNIQKVSSCKVDLYIEKQLTGKFYILKTYFYNYEGYIYEKHIYIARTSSFSSNSSCNRRSSYISYIINCNYSLSSSYIFC